MFVGITNTPRDYAWGSAGEISRLLGLTASGGPEAELWLGTHPGSPSTVVGSQQRLVELLGAPLPFLLKVLAAASPLSLQAHPSAAQAAEGFARENALGVPLDAPYRNYKDASAKPELIYALSGTFEALCGFRPVAQTRQIISVMMEGTAVDTSAVPLLQGWLDRLTGDESLRGVFEWLITRGEGVDDLVAAVTALASESAPSPELTTVALLAETSAGDPGIAISLMLNRVTLRAGEALYLPAGNIHAYLSGVGIELMSASDNVLRGGLTPKHIDVPELLRVLDFRPLPVPQLVAESPAAGVRVFRPVDADFALHVIERDAVRTVTGPAIALCLEGEFTLSGGAASVQLRRGSAICIAGESQLTITGRGQLVLATS
ncbi:MAG: mannose-6-phosphate isomerase, class I [Rhodoglobus sp.]